MAQYYSVTLNRKVLKTVYDAAGAVVLETEELISVTYHDLPHSTALAYARQFPDAGVKIAQQAVESSEPRRAAKSRNYYEKAEAVETIGSEDIEKDSSLAAAVSGDMGAAITAMKESA